MSKKIKKFPPQKLECPICGCAKAQRRKGVDGKLYATCRKHLVQSMAFGFVVT